jgi:hypothetical protein
VNTLAAVADQRGLEKVDLPAAPVELKKGRCAGRGTPLAARLNVRPLTRR